MAKSFQRADTGHGAVLAGPRIHVHGTAWSQGMKLAALAILALAAGFPALAQQPPPSPPGRPPVQEIRGPCHDDALKFCKEVQPGAGRLVACLAGNVDKLTPACQTQVKRVQERQKARQGETGTGTLRPRSAAPPGATKP